MPRKQHNKLQSDTAQKYSQQNKADSPLGQDNKRQETISETALLLSQDPPLQSCVRVTSNTYLFRDLTSHSSQLFFFLIGRVPGREGMWKEAQLEYHSSFSPTICNKHFRSLRKYFSCSLINIFSLICLFYTCSFICIFFWHTLSQHVGTSTRPCLGARVFKAFPTDVLRPHPETLLTGANNRKIVFSRKETFEQTVI